MSLERGSTKRKNGFAILSKKGTLLFNVNKEANRDTLIRTRRPRIEVKGSAKILLLAPIIKGFIQKITYVIIIDYGQVLAVKGY